jgi:hypothetical protein
LSRRDRTPLEKINRNLIVPQGQNKKMSSSSKTELSAKPSDTVGVDAYMAKLKHPLKKEAELLRQIILKCDKSIGEEIAWNAPSFFYTGKMKPFKPKEYKRFILNFNLFKKDCIRLIFLRGEQIKDKSGLLEGDFADGRRIAIFNSADEIKKRKKDLENVVKTCLKQIHQ